MFYVIVNFLLLATSPSTLLYLPCFWVSLLYRSVSLWPESSQITIVMRTCMSKWKAPIFLGERAGCVDTWFSWIRRWVTTLSFPESPSKSQWAFSKYVWTYARLWELRTWTVCPARACVRRILTLLGLIWVMNYGTERYIYKAALWKLIPYKKIRLITIALRRLLITNG